jgi:hypothetical protein
MDKQKWQVWETVHYQWIVEADTEEEARAKVWQWLDDPHEGRVCRTMRMVLSHQRI